MARLSALERLVLSWLVVEREPVQFAELATALEPEVARADAVEAVEALQRRSLLEWGTGGAFTMQPVVLEYVTARLVEDVAREILAQKPALLVGQSLLKATAKDYVRRSQERLIVEPLLTRVRASLGAAEAVERQLLALLGTWRGGRRQSKATGQAMWSTFFGSCGETYRGWTSPAWRFATPICWG